MASRWHQRPGEEVDFFIRGCAAPVGVFPASSYPKAPGRFQYDPYRGPGHARLCQVLSDGPPARCWLTIHGRRIAFEVTREDFVLGPPGGSSDWFVEVSRVGGTAPS